MNGNINTNERYNINNKRISADTNTGTDTATNIHRSVVASTVDQRRTNYRDDGDDVDVTRRYQLDSGLQN